MLFILVNLIWRKAKGKAVFIAPKDVDIDICVVIVKGYKAEVASGVFILK